MITKQHFADVDDSEIKSDRQMQLKCQYLQGFKDGVESQREFCSNAVNREEVFEQIDTWISSGEWRYTNATKYLKNRISELSTVIPERPKGEWELTDDKQSYCCSCCKNHWISAIEHLYIWKYCPNCGARMVESAERMEVDSDEPSD